jgi:hypothetical protein
VTGLINILVKRELPKIFIGSERGGLLKPKERAVHSSSRLISVLTPATYEILTFLPQKLSDDSLSYVRYVVFTTLHAYRTEMDVLRLV